MSFDRKSMRRMLTYKKLLGYRLRRTFHNSRIRLDLGVVFIHIPKTGGNSVTRALSSIPETGPNLSPKIAKHAKAEEVRFLLGEEEYDRCFSFALVRNPWDLMVSSYHWWLQKAPTIPYHSIKAARVKELGGFEGFIGSTFGTDMINERRGDMFDWYTDGEKQIVSHVARLEDMDTGWNGICEMAGIDPVPLPHINRSDRSGYREYYSDATRKLVENRFRRTIDRFEYRF